MASNPNWPRLQALWAPAGHIGYGPSNASFDGLPWMDVTRRLIGPWSINRGRQYELDQVTTGTWSGVLDNRDGLFDPNNLTSAVGGDVVPYQPFRIRAQWPVTANLFTPAQAIALTTAQANTGPGTVPDPADCGWNATPGVTSLTFSTSSSAYVGNYVLVATAGAGATAWLTCNQPITPGASYSFQIWARVTSGPALQLLPNMEFHSALDDKLDGANGPPVVVGTSWTRLTVSGTAPDGAAFAQPEIAIATTSAMTLQLCAAQFEAASAPSTFVNPGVWYPLFTGGIERYPQTWRANGTLGFVSATAVDALALLSQSKLQDPFTAAAFKPDGGPTPTFAYLLSDSGGGIFVDATGQRSPAQAGVGTNGAGTLTAGIGRAAASPGGLFVCPAGTSVVKLAVNGTTGAADPYQGTSFIRIPPSNTGQIGPGAGGFTRMIAFRALVAPQYRSAIWLASTYDAPSGKWCQAGIVLDPNMSVSGILTDPTHQSTSALVPLGTADLGNWHLAFVYLTGDGTEIGGAMDYSSRLSAASPTYTKFPAGAFTDDLIGAASIGAGWPGNVSEGFNGDVALAMEWPGVLSSAQINTIVTAWRSGWSGDSSGERFGRILTSAGWNGPVLADWGDSASLSPATDIDGTDAASALQAVADTEGGVLFVDAAGKLVLTARSDRWAPLAPPVVFGENTASGEWAYEDSPVFDYDPTLVTNLAEVTHQASGAVLTAVDFASQTVNGVRDRQVTSQASTTQECQDKASFLVLRYKIPRTRVAAMTVDPSSQPAMWPVVLGLDIGSRAKAIRRPAAPAVPVSVDGFVENLAWTVDISGQARLTMQISPADTTAYGRFDISTFDHFVFGY